jgi:hypothetical protein
MAVMVAEVAAELRPALQQEPAEVMVEITEVYITVVPVPALAVTVEQTPVAVGVDLTEGPHIIQVEVAPVVPVSWSFAMQTHMQMQQVQLD